MKKKPGSKLIPEPTYPMRINKYLALHKHSTRRGADELIKKRLIFINGKQAVLGDKVNETDNVEVKFRGLPKEFVYFAYNKPIGVVSHSPEKGQKDIRQSIKPRISRKDVFPVGRLDRESHGLIILTNDGRITDPLLSPNYVHDKEYLVTTGNKLRTSFKQKAEAGVNIEGYTTLPCKVEIINDFIFKITLTEGKKHQIRRMCSALFQEIKDLKRIRIMNIRLENLAPSDYRQIEGKELEIFLRSLGL